MIAKITKIETKLTSITPKAILMALLLFSCIGFSQTNFYLGTLDQTAWNNLNAEVTAKKSTLQTRIVQAEAVLPTPLETSYAKGTVISVDEFVKYASRDRQFATTLQTKYEGQGYGFWNGLFETQLAKEPTPSSPAYPSGTLFSVHNPLQQLHDCIKILDRAIAEIDAQLADNIALPETRDFTTPGYPTLPTNSSYYQKDGNVIFPSTFWGLRDDNLDILETLGYLGEVFHSAGNTQIGTFNGNPNSIITVPNFAATNANKVSNQVGNNQTPTQIQLTHTNLSSAITTKYPGIGDFPRAFVHYDIDHPDIKAINESILGTYVPQIASAAPGSPLIYVLSNEPHWDLEQRTGSEALDGVSNNTYNAYVEYLKDEYGNDINALNVVYNPFNGNQNFANFDALKTAYTIPLNRTTWQGKPIWYDWLRFNMNRSNRWHQDLKDIVLTNDVNAKVSIKVLGRELEDQRRDGGIDLETLMDLQDVIGFDNQVVPNETHGRNNRVYSAWLSDYVMDWREQSMMLDFARSLHPNKPTFDSEWHGHSSNAWANFALDAGYTRSALWMAFTNGLSVINNWWWYRDSDGDLLGKTGGVGNTMFSPQHQAVAFDEFGRTLKELNAHSNTVATLVPEERDYLLYYSAEAAIQDYAYAEQLAITYEALKLLNVKVGFTTESKINSLGYTPKAIIISPTLFIKDSSIDALNTFNDNLANSSVDIVRITRSGTTSFIKDEKGTPDASRSISFANQFFNFTNVLPTLITRLKNNLSSPLPPHVVDFDITLPGTNTEAFGVFAAQGKTPDNKNVVSLINISLSDREIQLSNFGINLINGEPINSPHIMKPYDVILLLDGTSLSTERVEKVVKNYVYYPNPVSDVLTIKNTYQGNYTLYNITGAVIKSIKGISDTVEISVHDLSTGIYFLQIPTEKGKQTEKIIVNR